MEIFNGEIISITSTRTLKFYRLNSTKKKYECVKQFNKSGVVFYLNYQIKI